jgi:chromosome segregation ATPase
MRHPFRATVMQTPVSVASPLPWSEWDGVHTVLAEISAGQEETGRFLGDLFGQLERLWNDLMRRYGAWQAEREKAQSELGRHAAELGQRAAELEQQRAAVAAQRERVRDEVLAELTQAAVARAAENEQVQQMLAQIEQERAALVQAREAAQTQWAELARVTAELTETRKAIQEEREQWVRAEAARAEAAPAVPDEHLLGQLRGLEEERAASERERVVLETELEAVRGRASEMAETLARQGRQMAEERLQWSDELKQMRRLLEGLSQRRPEPEPVHAPAAAQPRGDGRPAAGHDGGDSDPVLSSVMAQFEMLQKDLARRRKVAATPG